MVEIGDLRIDRARREVSRAGEVLKLTPTEFRMLGVLSRHPGRVVTHDQMLREVWGPNVTHQHHYLRVHMGNLRRKIERVPSRPRVPADGAGRGLSAAGGG